MHIAGRAVLGHRHDRHRRQTHDALGDTADRPFLKPATPMRTDRCPSGVVTRRSLGNCGMDSQTWSSSSSAPTRSAIKAAADNTSSECAE
jgi:hypothetical protein